MVIIEKRNISLPNMSDTLSIIMPPDRNGYRARLDNVNADKGANIIRIINAFPNKKC